MRVTKFKNLTDDEKQLIRESYYNKEGGPWERRAAELGNHFNVSERTIRKWCSEKLGFKEKVEIDVEQFEKAKTKVLNREKKRFLITWAQNNTSINKFLLSNMEIYADFLDAEIHVIAGRYMNPTSLEGSKNRKLKESWSPELDKYLDANRHDIHKYLSIMSDIKVHPTAVTPMSGMEGVSGINSCIFGSPKVQMSTIPVLEGQKPKMMMTTGSITKKNYTDSKSGKKGEFHHTYGFVVVEIKDDETFFTRQVTAKEDGSFYDLYYKVSNGVVSRIDSVAALVLGDYHVGDQDDVVIDRTLDMMSKIKPKHVVLHDVFNGSSINHHEMENPFIQHRKEQENTNSLKGEVDEMLAELSKFKGYNVVVVRSNHDDFVDRWLVKTDWRKSSTPKNSIEYMQYSLALLSGEAHKGVIPWIIDKHYPQFKTLKRSDSLIVKGWELAQHGDIGSNGSRGSLDQYRRLNTKIVIGHSHSPGRKDGVLQVGTSTKLRVGYNVGASGWLQSHVLIHENGKAQHIHFIEGEFTTLQ